VNPLLRDVAPLLGGDWEQPAEVATVNVLPSRLAASDLANGAVAAASLAAAGLSHARRGPRPSVRVDGRAVSAVFRSDRLVQVNGQPVQGFAELSRFWQTRDGWVRTHANYPHHRQRLLVALDLPATARAGDAGARLAELSATEAEERVVAAGGVCAAVRTPEEWRRHPQAAAVRALPLISMTVLDDAAPRYLPAPPRGPLLPAAGLRVLDFTRVIAGPVATATLAFLGADVLRLDPPHLPELPEMHLLNGMGKRSALLDITRDRELLRRLISSADVVVTGYRPGALDPHGLSPHELARTKPGIVVASLTAWGNTGPWGQRRGFDSIVQAASGIACAESDDRRVPGALPAQALDYATGFLMAAAILTAVARQHLNGATVLIQAHLARTAAWLLDRPDRTMRVLPDVSDLLLDRNTPVGRVRYPKPAVHFEDAPADWPTAAAAWGTDSAAWR
jgi:CoA-transferase family III